MEKETPLSKTQSSLTKDINKLKKMVSSLVETNRLKGVHIKQFDSFTKKLLKEKRITKDELSEYILKKPKTK